MRDFPWHLGRYHFRKGRSLLCRKPWRQSSFNGGFLKSDYSDEERDFPTGPEKAWSWTISYLRLKHLAQIRSRGPEKRPKTIPTTTFSTATSEKTTQNSGLITRHFARRQVIITETVGTPRWMARAPIHQKNSVLTVCWKTKQVQDK